MCIKNAFTRCGRTCVCQGPCVDPVLGPRLKPAGLYAALTAEPSCWPIKNCLHMQRQEGESRLPCPFLRPMSSFLKTEPPLGMHFSPHSSFSFSSSICSSVSPCILGGRNTPCSASSSISEKQGRAATPDWDHSHPDSHACVLLGLRSAPLAHYFNLRH